MFLGTYEAKIDGKGRLLFPAQFRAAQKARGSGSLFLFRSLTDRAIEGWTLERLDLLRERLQAMSPFSKERTQLERMIFGCAQDLAIDGDGRCFLAKPLTDHAGIGTEVSFIGRGDGFQIWDTGALAKTLGAVDVEDDAMQMLLGEIRL